MTGAPWLHVVGIGEDGLEGLAPAPRARVAGAEVLVGGARHLAMVAEGGAERIAWPSPWDAMLDALDGLRGRRVVVLVTGDPMWFSAGERIAARFGAEAALHPHPSAFQLAAARMGWPLQDCECLSLHGRPVETVAAALAPGARLLCLAARGTARPLAAILTARGYGASRMTALSHMGGLDESRAEGRASAWTRETPPLVTLAVDCRLDDGALPLPRTGLPDDAFQSDGTMTKLEVRAPTLARLRPMPGALLWDVGCGAGSVAIEWMRAARGAHAIGIEPREDRRAMAAANARTLGVPGLELIAGEAPAALAGLPRPQAAFVGGGLSAATFAAVWGALPPGGRFVANAVTLGSQAVLLDLYARLGGELARLAVSRAEPLGGRTGWRPAMEVMQWAVVKEDEYLSQEEGQER